MEDVSLDARVGRAFYGSFPYLTAVQQRAEQPLLKGSEVVVLSGTGSGKTAGVLAPLIQRHLLLPRKENQAAIVYIVPTKALGNDIVRRITPPLLALGLSVGLRHGDAPHSRHAHRADLIVITPESLDVLVSGGSHLLRGVRAIVIDEAHLLYNTQRGLQLAILIRRLEARNKHPIQAIGLSATISSPKHLWNFFRPHVDESDVTVISGTPGRRIEAAVRVEQTKGDVAALMDRIDQRDHFKVLVFVNSRRMADQFAAEMQRSHSFRNAVFIHHSSIAGDLREQTEKEFSVRQRAICVATTTLELGIDIGDVDLVLLYGLSGSWESFLQRIGRGNRRGDRAKVLCICPHDNSYKWLTTLAFLGTLHIARTGCGNSVPPMRLHGAVVQQVFSALRERKGGYIRLADIAKVLAPWPHLTRSTVDEIADALVANDYCVRHGFQHRIGAGHRLHELEALRLLWGNFPARSRDIPLRARGRQIGTISASNLSRLSRGHRVRFAGGVWTIDRVQTSGIDLMPTRGGSSDIEIGYLGAALGVDPILIETARQMLVNRTWKLDELATFDAEKLHPKLQGLAQTLNETDLPFVIEKGIYCYLTLAGALVNDVICRTQDLDGYEVDDLCIWSPRPVSFRQLPKEPELLVDHAAESLIKADELTIFQSMLPSSLMRRDIVESWCRNPCYAQILQRLVQSNPQRIASMKFRMFLE